ncbi:MAG: ROK family protein, partial [Gammaproteobacteria bacterium]|nr:ROK family protein [Gammaproteobacteria bacterium]
MKRLGLDLGGTKIEGVVLADDGKILIRKRISTPRDSDNAIAYTEMLSAIRNFITELENNVNSPCSIGIGTPGTISAETGLLKNSNTVCLNGKPFLDDLENCLNRDIRIANDANCFALSESTNGAGKGYASVFGIIMGTGVGGGIVINNCIHAGAMGIAGEWGHNPLQANGPDCYCGRSGCVETLISGPGFVSDYQRSGG